MQVTEALHILGAERVIWIDDRFDEITPSQLAKQLTDYFEVTLACEFPEVEEALEVYEIDPDRTTQEVAQILTDLPPDRFSEIETNFFEKRNIPGHFTDDEHELSSAVIAKACELLCVNEEDRWSFEDTDQNLAQLCDAGDGDTHLCYIVDLKEADGSSMRGVEVLRQLSDASSKWTYFILTHETDMAGEGETETKLLEEFPALKGLGIPTCVIAKERLYDKADDLDGMEEALRICIKRAGLRRSLHEVLNGVQNTMNEAIDAAARKLLSIPPENLESHVFERGFKEGVSELHIVERAITAFLGKESREFFGNNNQVHASTKRLRALRDISIKGQETGSDPHLSEFREAEVWESDKLVNRALTPIACGDVFKADHEEEATENSSEMFILLAQPCDISLRPKEGSRKLDAAFLVPLKKKNPPKRNKRDDPKMQFLPFILSGENWACDFGNATTVRLSILDLASFRPDGYVSVDSGHEPRDELLEAQKKIYEDRTAAADRAMIDDSFPPNEEEIPAELLLTFSTSGCFTNIYRPFLEKAIEHGDNGKIIETPKRITWRLRRHGRVRMPYAAVLLDQYTTVMSRQAFDLNF